MTQVTAYCRQAGFSDPASAAAVAMKISNGDPNLHNLNAANLEDCYGLFQINMYGFLADARLAEFGLKKATDLYDPLANCKAARKVYDVYGWAAWSNASLRSSASEGKWAGNFPNTWQPSIKEPTNGVVDEGLIPGNQGVANAVSNLTGGWTSVVEGWVTSFFVILIAIVLVVLGILVLNKGSIKTAVGVAGKAALL